MAKSPTFDETKLGYRAMWDKMKYTKPSAINKAAQVVINNKDAYRTVAEKTGVPWFWIGAIHMRESSNDFRGVLHNGERILGTGKKTKLEPKGRGPFSTWAEAAVDALEIKGLQNIKEWDIPRMLYEAERFNGWGYTYHGVNSPYVWGGTNLQQSGKYVADGVWDPNAVDKQLGVAPVISKVMELEVSPVVPQKPSSPKQNDDRTGNIFLKILKLLFWKGK